MPDPNFIDDFAPPLDMSPGDRFVVQPVGPRTNDYVAPTAAQHWIAGMAGTFDGVNRNTGVTGGVTISVTPPTPAIPGMLWWDSVGGQLYVYYKDGNSQQWVIANNATIEGGGMLDFPAFPTLNQVYGGWLWDGVKWTTASGGGPFLPLTGGTVTGALDVTATGGNTSRSVQDRFSEVINVKDFGAKGDGAADDTAAIAAALAAVTAAGGGALYLPNGTYKISAGELVLHSHTKVFGDGPGVSIIKPEATGPFEVFQGYLTSTLGYPFETTPPGGIYDTDIAIESLGFDFSGTTGAAIGSVLFVRGLYLADLKFWGSPSITVTGVRCISCDRVTMRDSIGDNVNQMLDCWGGTTRVKTSNLDVSMNPGGGNGGAFNLQGVSTLNGFGHSYQYEATNINIQMNGGVAFFFDSQGDGSITSDVLLENITIVATGGSNQPVIGRGRGGRIKMHNMNCVALSGATWSVPISLGAFFSYEAPETGTSKITTQSGSNVITVTFTSGTEAGVGNYVYISGSSGSLVGNGLTLLNAYTILSVVSRLTNNLANVVTCDARANATSSGPITATTNIVGYQGSFHDCELNGITLDGAQTSGQPIINLGGSGHQLNNINITTNYGASPTPQYNAIVASGGSAEPDITARPITAASIEGTPGTGALPAGYVGDNSICWSPFAPQPVVSLSNPITSGIAFAGTASNATDLSKGIQLDYGFGINTFGGAIDYVVPGPYTHLFYVGSSEVGFVNGYGWNGAIGQDPGAENLGTFTQVRVGDSAGPTWSRGSGAPSATQPNSSLYSRVDGTTGSRLYVSAGGGTWNAVAGV